MKRWMGFPLTFGGCAGEALRVFAGLNSPEGYICEARNEN